jgi:hypothetical protein
MSETIVEEWRDIPNHFGCQVSSFGNVRSFWHRIGVLGGGKNRWVIDKSKPPRVLRPDIHKGGYPWCSIRASRGSCSRRSIHSLVLEVFTGPRPVGFQACHIDGDSGNSSLCNLKWDTASANAQERSVHGTQAKQRLTVNDVIEIKRLKAIGLSHNQVAIRYGLRKSYVALIHTGRKWGWVLPGYAKNVNA